MNRMIQETDDSDLMKHVVEWVNEQAVDYTDTGVSGVLEDLSYGGCASGFVGHLIYYTETEKFYEEHQKEIDNMLQEMCSDCGSTPQELFGEKWDKEDPLARDILNKNLLAWFGFEETARRLEDRECELIEEVEHCG